jgi:PAS domain S-box-containing protein
MHSTLRKAFNIKLAQKGLILVGVPLVLELTFILSLSILLKQVEHESVREVRAKEVMLRADHVNALASELAMATAAIVETRQQSYLRSAQHCALRLPKESEALANLIKDNIRQRQVAANLEILGQVAVNSFQFVNTHQSSPPAVLAAAVNEVWRASYEVSAQLERIIAEESLVSAERLKRQNQWRDSAQLLVYAGVAVDVLVTISLALFFATALVNRLKILQDNSKRLSVGAQLLQPLSGADEIADLDQTFHDMAAKLTEAMRKERAVVENAVDVICSLDQSGVFSKVNPASLTVWGYTPEELVGSNYLEIIAAEDVTHTERSVQEIVETKSTGQFENRVKSKDGILLDMLWSVHYSAAEKALFCVVHDIRERKELERLKQEFVAIVSHDLRTPLTSILGGMAIIKTGKMGELNERGQQIIATAEKSGARLIRLVNDLLDMEKLEAGKFELELESTPLAKVLSSSAEAVGEFAKQNSITINTPADAPTVIADGDRIEQVVINLLSNAIKFSPVGGVIDVTVDRKDKMVEVRIADQGLGIPESHRDVIFEKFKQVRISDAKKKRGTGLGLPICKALIEQHGGSIGVESKEGAGSTFWFCLPATEES